MVKDSVEILADVIEDELRRVSIRYYSVTHSREETITTCEGDLIVICNVLADYADLLDEFLKDEKERERLGFCAVMQYERMRDRCRKITAELQEKTGYDRDAAIEKCRRRAERKPKADAGIGEDALVLSARRRAEVRQKTEQPATEDNQTE
ncbi:MAG: hypothetical protein NC305_05160 [Lachnospiraceae bacterium]|nr:hypothetical protein [Muribaculum sp.]MCM1409917.1 hypothetical protein [Lachnospiraceae bacterium]